MTESWIHCGLLEPRNHEGRSGPFMLRKGRLQVPALSEKSSLLPDAPAAKSATNFRPGPFMEAER